MFESSEASSAQRGFRHQRHLGHQIARLDQIATAISRMGSRLRRAFVTADNGEINRILQCTFFDMRSDRKTSPASVRESMANGQLACSRRASPNFREGVVKATAQARRTASYF